MFMLRLAKRFLIAGFLLSWICAPAYAQYGSLNRDKSGDAVAASERAALSDIVRFLRAHTDLDLETASAYYPPDQRAQMETILRQPGGKQSLIETENLIRNWQMGCLTCSTPDTCIVDLTLRMSKAPSESIYRRWKLEYQNHVWSPTTSDALDTSTYWQSVNSCPRQMQIPPRPAKRDVQPKSPPKTWQEQVERAEVEAQAKSVDEFDLGAIDF